MRNLFTDFNYREQLQYKALVILINNQIMQLRVCQYDAERKEKLQKQLLIFELLEIYAMSLYAYLTGRVGLLSIEAEKEVDLILSQINNLSCHKHTKIRYNQTPINLEVEEVVEEYALKESAAIHFAIEELYNTLISKMLPSLNTDGTQMLFAEIRKFNELFDDRNKLT